MVGLHLEDAIPLAPVVHCKVRPLKPAGPLRSLLLNQPLARLDGLRLGQREGISQSTSVYRLASQIWGANCNTLVITTIAGTIIT